MNRDNQDMEPVKNRLKEEKAITKLLFLIQINSNESGVGSENVN